MADNLEDDTVMHPDDGAEHTCDIPDVGADNNATATTTTISEEEQKGESYDSESPSKDADIESEIVLWELGGHGSSTFPPEECAKGDDSSVHESRLSLSSRSATSGKCDSSAGPSEEKQARPDFQVTDTVSIPLASIEDENEEVDPPPGTLVNVTILVPTHRRAQAFRVKRLEEFVDGERPSDDFSTSKLIAAHVIDPPAPSRTHTEDARPNLRLYTS
ncbi:hypothetical protein PISMIDRAFT_276701 [Pisolithus microcarpus 441]|uniref:Uncharacterized protein n=1 Tax=Pisolithus microcarpus 441 TaxID=765257 RepID=A0A0C9YHM7_9AGAM|nr:hypothetical protein BKA83DRAFT_276701 [Pisolithus microcarpus]KIK16196.1 hypothetical protein PISMIDRAFT_276701 [Pisolithus microcarpus 441]